MVLNMNKVSSFLIAVLLVPLMVFFILLQVINFYFFKHFTLTFDYRLLFFQGNNDLFFLGLLLSLMVLGSFFINLVFPTKNEFKKDKRSDHRNYSKLLSRSNSKKGLVRIEFDKYARPKDFSIRFIIDQIFNPLKLFYNKIIDFLRLDHQLKLNTLKSFYLNDNKHYRAGLPLVTSSKAVWVDPENNHALIIGTTNSGKTYSIVHILIVICIMNGENITVNDVKEELYRTHYAYLISKNYNVFKIDFITPEAGECYNPLGLAIDYYHNAYDLYKKELITYKDTIIKLLDLVIDYQDGGILDELSYREYLSILPVPNYSEAFEVLVDVCNKICQESKNDKDGFWNDSAGDLLEGLTALLLEDYTVFDGEVHFLNKDLINFANVNLLSNFVASSGKKQSPIIDYLEKYRSPNDISYLRLWKIISENSDRTLTSILTVFNRVMKKLLLNSNIVDMLSKSSLDLSKIDSQKTAIFIVVHDEKDTFHNLVSIIIQQIYEALIKIARDNVASGLTKTQELLIPMNFIYDEFANGSKVPNIVNCLTAGRRCNIRFYLIIQDDGQLEAIYGKDMSKTIKSNVVNTIFLLSSENSTKEEISKACGKKIVYNKAHNRYDELPVVSVDRLTHLSLGEAVILRQRRDPYITNLKAFNKYHFTKHMEKLRKKIPLPKPRKLDRHQSFNLLKEHKDIRYYE